MKTEALMTIGDAHTFNDYSTIALEVDNEIVRSLVFLAGLRPLPPVREQGVKWVLIEVVQYQRFHYEPKDKKKGQGYWQDNGLEGTYDKVRFAIDAVEHLTLENLEGRFDLKEMMEQICGKITEWNNIRPLR
jgi:hypothetical protein